MDLCFLHKIVAFWKYRCHPPRRHLDLPAPRRDCSCLCQNSQRHSTASHKEMIAIRPQIARAQATVRHARSLDGRVRAGRVLVIGPAGQEQRRPGKSCHNPRQPGNDPPSGPVPTGTWPKHSISILTGSCKRSVCWHSASFCRQDTTQTFTAMTMHVAQMFLPRQLEPH